MTYRPDSALVAHVACRYFREGLRRAGSQSSQNVIVHGLTIFETLVAFLAGGRDVDPLRSFARISHRLCSLALDKPISYEQGESCKPSGSSAWCRVTILLLALLALILTATAVGWLLVGWSLLSFLGLL